MKGRIYTTLAAARAAQAAQDTAAGHPRDHAEGDGPDDFVIRNPGRASERIRACGVRTEHLHEVVGNDAGTQFALLDPSGPDEVPLHEWTSPP